MESWKTYTGLEPPIHGRPRSSGEPLEPLRRKASENLATLEQRARRARNAREAEQTAKEEDKRLRRIYMNGLRTVKREIKAAMKVARAAGDAKEFNRLYEYGRDVQDLLRKGWE